MSITRRLFLRNAAAAGAVGTAATAPAGSNASTSMTTHEQALWHIRELERLVLEDGGRQLVVIIQATYGPADSAKDIRGIGINAFGQPFDNGGMFAARGSDA